MKKFLPIFTALLIALFAIACGGGEDTAKKEMTEKPAEMATPSGYEVMTVANGGTISGTVTYAGAIPKKVEIQKTDYIANSKIQGIGIYGNMARPAPLLPYSLIT